MTTVMLILMGLTASVASFFLKKATGNGLHITTLLRTPYLYAGGGLYALSALMNLYLLRRLPYSLVVPLGSLTYIWTLILSWRFLGERVSRQKIIGIMLILVGVCALFFY